MTGKPAPAMSLSLRELSREAETTVLEKKLFAIGARPEGSSHEY
jgi:hypothetical protein